MKVIGSPPAAKEVFELARCPAVSNYHDLTRETPFKGITIPYAKRISGVRGGMLEMDDPEHRLYRTAVNPYLSPAAVKRWEPFIDEIVRASLDEKIERRHNRLRRRPGQRRASSSDVGDAGDTAEEVVALQRTDSCLGVYAGGLS